MSDKGLATTLAATRLALYRTRATRHRLQAKLARHDSRAWQVKRRERTRHLIELGGLVVKAGLIELVDDDRAVILGLLTEAAGRLRGEDREAALTLWRRRGKRAFVQEDGSDDRPQQGSPYEVHDEMAAMREVVVHLRRGMDDEVD